MATTHKTDAFHYCVLPQRLHDTRQFCWTRKDAEDWWHSFVRVPDGESWIIESTHRHRRLKHAKARALRLLSQRTIWLVERREQAQRDQTRRAKAEREKRDQARRAKAEREKREMTEFVARNSAVFNQGGESREELLMRTLQELREHTGDGPTFEIATVDMETGHVRFNREGVAALFTHMRTMALAECPICGSSFSRSNGVTTCPQATCRASSPRFMKRITKAVEKALPDTLPMDVRDDAYQELVIAAMTKKILLREVPTLAPQYIRQAWRQRQGLFDRSLDEQVGPGLSPLLDLQTSGGIAECQICGMPLEYGRLCKACTAELEQQVETDRGIDRIMVRKPKGRGGRRRPHLADDDGAVRERAFPLAASTRPPPSRAQGSSTNDTASR